MIVTPKLSTYRQQLWISAQLMTQQNDQETFSHKCTVSLHVEGLIDKTTKKVVGGSSHNRTR